MADNHELDDANTRKQSEQIYDGPTHDRGVDSAQNESATYSTSLIGDGRLSNRGNAPVRAAVMRQAQQTYGNRAVQRVLQRSATEGTVTEEPIGEQIRSKAGGGNSLDGGVQRQLESGLGADMSGVRVHTDGEADSMARSVDSVAFTTGNDIFFRSGAYDPGSQQGMHLLAHEATHTVQQAQGPVSGTPSAGGVSISDPSDSYEQAAEAAAANVVSGGSTSAQRMSAGTAVQREAAPEEEEMQTMRASTYSGLSVQREAAPEEEEEMQTMRASTFGTLSVQREAAPDEEEMQTMTTSTYGGLALQRHSEEEEG